MAAEEAGAQMQCARQVRWRSVPGGWQFALTTPSGSRVSLAGAWVVDCTGRAARFACSQGARRLVEDRLVAFSVRLGPLAPETIQQRIRLEAVSEGWWYLAPAPPGQAALTFLTDGDLPAARAARSPAGFAVLLAETVHVRKWVAALGYPLAAPVQAEPAASVRLAPAVGTRWLAAGDAVLACDPLAGQGVAFALHSATSAAGVLLHTGPARELAAVPLVARYQETLDVKAGLYSRLLRQVYSAEPRWPDAPFWQRRRWTP
jgi:flavin-dependent dehydrogenase